MLKKAVAAVLVSILVAGCSTGGPSVGVSNPNESAENMSIAANETPSLTKTALPGPTTTLSSSPTPEPLFDPWGDGAASVHVAFEAGPKNSTLERALNKEFSVWENNSETWTNQTASFSVGASRSNADLTVVFVSDVAACGSSYSRQYIGCSSAWVYENSEIDHATISIEVGYSYETIRETIRHELGHLYGLEHSDSDRFPWMSESVKVAR